MERLQLTVNKGREKPLFHFVVVSKNCKPKYTSKFKNRNIISNYKIKKKLYQSVKVKAFNCIC
jgi:hypothetical protein